MPEITIGSGGGNAEAGVHILTLKKVGDKHIVTMPENSPYGGGDVEMWDWEWVLPNGEPLRESITTASGPKSKSYARFVALNNGRAPKYGEKINTDDYIGRRVIGTIEIKDSGWPKIASVSAIPADMQQRDFAAATGAPVREPELVAAAPAVVSPLRAVPAGAPPDDLDF